MASHKVHKHRRVIVRAEQLKSANETAH